MSANVEWACPEVTECWAFRHRLYRVKKKAEIEKAKALKRAARFNEGRDEYLSEAWWNTEANSPIYRVTLTWEAT